MDTISKSNTFYRRVSKRTGNLQRFMGQDVVMLDISNYIAMFGEIPGYLRETAAPPAAFAETRVPSSMALAGTSLSCYLTVITSLRGRHEPAPDTRNADDSQHEHHSQLAGNVRPPHRIDG